MEARTLFILNPTAGHGRAARCWRRAAGLVDRLCPGHAVWATGGPGDGARLAQRGLEEGFARLVAVGGDGTLSEVVDGFLSAPVALRAGAAVGTWPAGTGCDFARYLGLPSRARLVLGALARPTHRQLDAGRVTCVDATGRERSRHFVNVAGFGLAADVAALVRDCEDRLGATLGYLVASVLAIARARARPLRLVVDGVAVDAALHLGIAANGGRAGGGMRLAPAADAADGWLDLVTVRDVTRVALARLLPRAYTGGHVGRPGVAVRRVRRLTVSGAGPWPLNVDGDLHGRLPATIEVLPGALPFLVGGARGAGAQGGNAGSAPGPRRLGGGER